jgi:hypothetical protein
LHSGVRRQRHGDDLFLPLDGRRDGHARRLDNVHDVDANARTILDDLRGNVLFDVVGHDGCNDVAVGATDIPKNTASLGLPLLHGIWILRHLARSRCWNLFARRGFGGGFDAIGTDKSCRSLALGHIVDRRRSLSIHTLENGAPFALPFTVRMWHFMPPK